MGLFAAVAAVMAWLFSSRPLFRYWVRHDSISVRDKQCSHGFEASHKYESCRGTHPARHAKVAAMAMLACLFLPVVIPVVLAVFFVICNPPLGRRELRERIRVLENENARLARAQEDRRVRED